jgi:Tol biopolymer transport system component
MSSGYTVDLSQETVDWIETGSDGSAVVGVFAPLIGPDGKTAGKNGNYWLLSPTGEKILPEHDLSTTFEWSPDGTKLAMTSYAKFQPSDPPTMTPTTTTSPPKRTLVVIGRDGKTLHGPFQGTQVDGINSLQWAGDGQSLVVNSGSGFGRFDISNGRFDMIPGQAASLDIGRDGRIIASGYVNNESSVFLIDPVTGATTPFAKRGTDPSWSPDSRSVVLGDLPPRYRDSSPSSLVVLDAGGTPRYTVTVPGHLTFGRTSRSIRDGFPAPQWAQSGRHLVVVVHPR